jgi:hypothetical protein
MTHLEKKARRRVIAVKAWPEDIIVEFRKCIACQIEEWIVGMKEGNGRLIEGLLILDDIMNRELEERKERALEGEIGA